MKPRISLASPGDAERIAELVVHLTVEIVECTGEQQFNLDEEQTAERCRRYIASEVYAVIVAHAPREDAFIGVLTLCESYALYTQGPFGIIQEFYVEPASRSRGIGAAMLERAMLYGKGRGWVRLELCTPPLPAFDRALAFYERCGFEVTGGRKMKCLLLP